MEEHNAYDLILCHKKYNFIQRLAKAEKEVGVELRVQNSETLQSEF